MQQGNTWDEFLLSFRRLRHRLHVNFFLPVGQRHILHMTLDDSVQRMIFANHHTQAGFDARAALAHDDVARLHVLAAVNFYAEPLRI